MIIIDSLLKFKCFLPERSEQFSLWRGRGEPLSFATRGESKGAIFARGRFDSENFALGSPRSDRWQVD